MIYATEIKVLNEIEKIISSQPTPYFEDIPGTLVVFVNDAVCIYIDCHDTEFESVKELIRNIHKNYQKHVLKTMVRISECYYKPAFAFSVDSITSEIVISLDGVNHHFKDMYSFFWVFGQNKQEVKQ